MKKNLIFSLAAFALTFLMSNSAMANEVFAKNCASCHAGGKNIMNADKDLSMASLEKNGVNSVAAIKDLVSNGKAPMPAFGSMLDAKEIDSVAAYVLKQAKKGW